MKKTYEDCSQGIAEDIQTTRSEITQNLAELLMFQTVSGSKDTDNKRLFLNETTRGFSFLSRLAKSMGLETRNYDNRVFIIEQPATEGGTEVVGLPLHLDVVPSGDGWHYPAFGGMIENDVLYGRGAQDDKGPIIQMLYALHMVKRLGLSFKRTVRLIIASQEETGDWGDIEFYLEKEQAPTFSIVSDSTFPIINGEKGFADVQIDLSWTNKPGPLTTLQFSHLKSGERSNIVPNRADLAWEATAGQSTNISNTLKQCLQEYLQNNPTADAFPLRLDVDPESQTRSLCATFLGKSAHGSRPEDGHNAALDALRFLYGVPELPVSLARVTQFLRDCCDDFYGGSLDIAGAHPFIGKTTVNLGILEMSKEKATAVLNIRNTLGMTLYEMLNRIKTRVQTWAEKNGITASVKFVGKAHEPLFLNPKQHPELITALQNSYRSVIGEEAQLRAESGTTYAKAFPNALCFGPVLLSEEVGLAHQADECIKISHLLRNVNVYALMLLQMAVDVEHTTTETVPDIL